MVRIITKKSICFAFINCQTLHGYFTLFLNLRSTSVTYALPLLHKGESWACWVSDLHQLPPLPSGGASFAPFQTWHSPVLLPSSLLWLSIHLLSFSPFFPFSYLMSPLKKLGFKFQKYQVCYGNLRNISKYEEENNSPSWQSWPQCRWMSFPVVVNTRYWRRKSCQFTRRRWVRMSRAHSHF